MIDGINGIENFMRTRLWMMQQDYIIWNLPVAFCTLIEVFPMSSLSVMTLQIDSVRLGIFQSASSFPFYRTCHSRIHQSFQFRQYFYPQSHFVVYIPDLRRRWNFSRGPRWSRLSHHFSNDSMLHCARRTPSLLRQPYRVSTWLQIHVGEVVLVLNWLSDCCNCEGGRFANHLVRHLQIPNHYRVERLQNHDTIR